MTTDLDTLRGELLAAIDAATALDALEAVRVQALGKQGAITGLLHEKGIPVPENAGWGKLLDALVSATVEPQLIQPTFLLDYPVELSPLAKRKREECPWQINRGKMGVM